MPISVPSAAAVSQKWVQRAGAASGAYRDGVQAVTNWAEVTAAANDVYVQAVTEAASAGRFARGVNNAGTAKWQRNALGKGAQRFGPGVAAAQGDYQSAMGPVLQIIAGLDLPPRGPRGAPQNIERVRTVAEALHQFRLQQGG